LCLWHADILEISLNIITRRNFLAGAGTCSLSPVIPFTRWSGSHTEMGKAIIVDDAEIPHGCIFARMDRKQSTTADTLTTPSIDFWSFRVSEIECTALPRSVGRIIVWDDVFSSRNVLNSVKSILKVFPEHYGFDPFLGTNSCSFHLDGFGEIGPIAEAVLAGTTGPIPLNRLAIIDIESCGVSRFDWPDILPNLRNCYDVVVGFAHFVGRSPNHLEELCDGVLDNSRTSKALACCDLSFFTSDGLLGFQEVPDYESRSPLLTALVHDLIHALSAIDFVRTMPGLPKATQFVVSRSRRERPYGNFSADLEYDAKCAPLMDGNITLWPLRSAEADAI
jgi:hypothetical protein